MPQVAVAAAVAAAVAPNINRLLMTLNLCTMSHKWPSLGTRLISRSHRMSALGMSPDLLMTLKSMT